MSGSASLGNLGGGGQGLKRGWTRGKLDHMLALLTSFFRRLLPSRVRALKQKNTVAEITAVMKLADDSPYRKQLAESRIKNAQALIIDVAQHLPENVDSCRMVFTYDDGAQLKVQCRRDPLALGRGYTSAPPTGQ